MNDLFAPPSEEELLASHDPMFAPPSQQEMGMPSQPEEQFTPAETFVRSAAQVPTLGFEDEIVGGAKGLYDVATTDNKMSDLEKLYTAYRDIERRKNELSSKQNPKSALAGTLAGGVATAAIPGLNIASVEGGALLGAASGLGSSEANLVGDNKEFLKAGKDAAFGGLVGGSVQKFANVLGLGPQGAAEIARNAEQKALKKGAESAYSALGASSKDMAGLQRSLRGGASEVAEDAAPELSDLAQRYVRPVGGPEESIKAIQGRIEEIESLKAPLFDQAEQQLGSLSTDQMQKLSGSNLKGKLYSLADEIAAKEKDLSTDQQIALSKQLRGMFDNYMAPLEGIPAEGQAAVRNVRDLNNVKALDQIKSELGSEIGGSGFQRAEKMASGLISPNASLEAKRSAYDLVKNQITDLGDVIGGNLGSQIKNLNKEESLLIKLRDTASNAAAKEATGTGTGAGTGIAMHLGAAVLGGSIGGPVGAAAGLAGMGAGLAGKKMLEDYLGQGVGRAAQAASSRMSQGAAKNLGGIASFLEKNAAPLSQASSLVQSQLGPGTVSSAAQKAPFLTKKDEGNLTHYSNQELQGVGMALAQNPDKRLAAYGAKLSKALQTGNNQDKNAAIFLIMQSPIARSELGLMKNEQQ